MSNLNESVRWPNPQQVRQQARIEWERREGRRLGVQERIGQSVPWWLVAIAGAFFALSAPHTSHIFDRLTPGWGWVAPIAVELSLLYAAFRRRQIAQSEEAMPSGLRWLEIFAFIVSILVNGAGSFTAVVAGSADTSTLSIAQLAARFGALPAQSQIALMLAPLSAFIIPVGTWVAGEGVAALILERRQTGNVIDQMWTRVRVEIEFAALRDAAVNSGISPGQASKWAAQLVREIGTFQTSAVSGGQSTPLLGTGLSDASPESSGLPAETSTGMAVESAGSSAISTVSSGSPQVSTGQGYTKKMDARLQINEAIQAHLAAGGTVETIKPSDLIKSLGVGKSTVYDVISEYKKASGS